MKKWLIGSIVGAIIIFGWQFLSWTILNIHAAEAKYHPDQDKIMNVLSSSIKEDGIYMVPTAKPGTTMEEHQALAEQMDGKPYASIMYKTAYRYDMVRPMIRGFLIDLSLVFLLIYILTRAGTPTTMRIFAGSVAVGFFTWLSGPYTMHNWFQTPIEATFGHLIDCVLAWGVVGLWLGWWLNRK